MRNVNYTEYDLKTGAILSVGNTSGKLPMVPDGIGRLLQSADIDRHYINMQTMRPVTRNVFHSGKFIGDEYFIDLPIGTELLWDGNLFVADEEITQILVDQVSPHLLILSHPLYFTKEFLIENPNAN